MEKLLTVIVPSYNMEKYLPKCLGSLVVAPELMERLEVLVVNDGSKDRTGEIESHGDLAVNHTTRDPFLRLSPSPNSYDDIFTATYSLGSDPFLR